MKTDVVTFQELIAIIKRHLLTSGMIIALCVVLATGFSYLVGKRYKSKAVLNIQAAYFQIPLVGDLVGGGSDSVENKAQRESLLHMAVNNEFVDQLGEKYQLFRYKKDDRRHVSERETLESRIEYFNMGSNSYQIAVTGPSAELAFKMTEDVLKQMTTTLIAERAAKLGRARAAIQSSLDTLKMEIMHAGVDTGPDKNGMMIQESLENEEAKLASLENKFTSSHPNVVQQRAKVDRLRETQPRKKDHAKIKGEPDGGVSASRRALQDLHDDLFRKYNYLNIVADMEKSTERYPYISVLEEPTRATSASFPKRSMFAIGGAVVGLVAALLTMVLRELRKGTFASPTHVAQIFDSPFLGSLPTWTSPQSLRALPAPKDT